MTTFTTRRNRRRAGEPRGFTLVEVMIGATLGSIVLAGVLSTFLMLSRSGANASAYAAMDAQSRRALDEFSQDVRMARAVIWNSAYSITLTVPDNYASTANQVTYTWDSTTNTNSPTYRCFYRVPGDSSATSPKTVFVRNVTSFTFYRYDRLNAPTTVNASIKRIQMAMTVSTTSNTAVSATDQMVSASYILRNKPAS